MLVMPNAVLEIIPLELAGYSLIEEPYLWVIVQWKHRGSYLALEQRLHEFSLTPLLCVRPP